MILQERLEKLHTISLTEGAHKPDSEFCIMEAVAWVAGEPWTDSPQCTCPVISAFLRSWNDSLPSDADRDRLLKPLIPRVIGTRSTKPVEKRRALMAADWLVRVHTPAWLRLAGLTAQAETLERLPEITSMAQVPSIRGPIEAVRQDAAAAQAAARDAAQAAAWAAAWDAARDAAWAAAWATAQAAARDKLKPTMLELQTSAVQLVERMIAASEETA